MSGNYMFQNKFFSVCAKLTFLIYVSTGTAVLTELKRHAR